jgi:mevalonate kinase
LAADGKSITLMLEDGGMGDEDGVQNGVIVDPSGIAYTDSDSASLSTGGVSSGGGGGGGCFITTLQGAGQSWVDADSGIWQWLKQSIGRCLALVNG